MNWKMSDHCKLRISVFFFGFSIGLIATDLGLKTADKFSLEYDAVEVVLQNVAIYKNPDKLRCKPDPLKLIINMDADGFIYVNNKITGTADDTIFLKNSLRSIFQEREKAGITQDEYGKTAKKVIIDPANGLRGKDLLKVVDTIEQSGAELIYIDWNEELIKVRITHPRPDYLQSVTKVKEVGSKD